MSSNTVTLTNFSTTAVQEIKAGEGVILSNQSANRDETVFQDANKFDIHRSPNPQIGFGFGTHVCVAEWLARAELEIVFGKNCPLPMF